MCGSTSTSDHCPQPALFGSFGVCKQFIGHAMR
jgi:hypothetical protein